MKKRTLTDEAHAVPSDRTPHVPKCGKRRTKWRDLPPEKQRCTKERGWGTDHPGIGPCKNHGGATPIKHGGRSKMMKEKLAQRTAELAKLPDLLSLYSEVAFLRALREEWLTTWGEKTGDRQAFQEAAALTDKIGSMVDRIEKHQQSRGISYATLNRLFEQYGLEIAAALREAGISEAEQDRFSEALARRIGNFRPDALTVNVAGLPEGT